MTVPLDLPALKAEARRRLDSRPASSDNWPMEEVTIALIDLSERAIAQIKADHAYSASVGGGSCICEWCQR